MIDCKRKTTADFNPTNRCTLIKIRTEKPPSAFRGWPISIAAVYNAPWFRIEFRGNRHPDGKLSLLQIYLYRY
jgi:hypothetical protein